MTTQHAGQMARTEPRAATLVADIAAVRAGDPCARCGAALELERGIEIGHIFKLGTRFTEAFGANYLDQDGAARPIVMGSYGIGVSRAVAAIADLLDQEVSR